MTLLPRVAFLLGALVATVPASADIVKWGGAYAGPGFVPASSQGPNLFSPPGRYYLGVKGKSDLKPRDNFVFGAFVVKRREVRSIFMPQIVNVPEFRLPGVEPFLFAPPEKPGK